jgi:C4-type Zn-finger protein
MTLQECPECNKEVSKLHEVHDSYWLYFQGHTIEQEYWCEDCIDRASEAAYDRFLKDFYGC